MMNMNLLAVITPPSIYKIPICDSTLIDSEQQATYVVVYIFPVQPKVMYKISINSLVPYISYKSTGYHFHLLAEPHPCRFHVWQDLFPK